MVRSQRAANFTARRMRIGSSRKRMSGIADRAHDARLEIGRAADVVDHLLGLEVVEQPVDGEVAAAGVLLGRAEDVVPPDQQIAALGLGAFAAFLFFHLARVGAERGRLDDLRSEEDVRQAEAAADDAAVLEQAPDVVRRRAGDDVEVFRFATEHQVADAAADQVGGVVVATQALDDFGGVGIDQGRVYLHSRLGVPHQGREITDVSTARPPQSDGGSVASGSSVTAGRRGDRPCLRVAGAELSSEASTVRAGGRRTDAVPDRRLVAARFVGRTGSAGGFGVAAAAAAGGVPAARAGATSGAGAGAAAQAGVAVGAAGCAATGSGSIAGAGSGPPLAPRPAAGSVAPTCRRNAARRTSPRRRARARQRAPARARPCGARR